jgi:hypothetical protein
MEERPSGSHWKPARTETLIPYFISVRHELVLQDAKADSSCFETQRNPLFVAMRKLWSETEAACARDGQVACVDPDSSSNCARFARTHTSLHVFGF